MSRRSRTGLTPSLFPFLAVLVCTLGTLILLLALVAKDAEDSAKEVAEQKQQKALQESVRVTQQERWRRQELQKLRQQQTEVLENKRSELAHVEDHLRRIRDQLESLQEEVKSSYVDKDDDRREKIEAAIAALEAEVARKKEELDDVKSKKNNAAPRVALVPHKGPSGTRRRPIYLECTGDSIIIQPEGVRITIAQLRGPSGPGNPLDAALRTIRNQWQSTGESGDEPPYPLLVVRPDGILAYLSARVSMTAWDDQYGYELVPEHVELEYSKPDELLAQRTQEAIDDSIRRRAAIVQAVPGRFRKGISGSDPLGEAIDKTRARQTNGFVQGRGDTRQQGTLASSPIGRWNSNLDSSITGQSTSAQEAAARSQLEGRRQENGFASGGSEGTPSSYNLGKLEPGDTAGGTLDEGFETGNPEGEGKTPFENSGNPDGLAASGSQTGSAGQSTSDASTEGEQQNQSAQNASVSLSAQTPLAAERGSDWAMRGASGSSDGPTVVRNINITCYSNRFEILNPAQGTSETILVERRNPEAAVVRLAKIVRDRVDNWGLALTGGRWQPILKVAVTENGQQNYHILNRLLDGSGISVKGRLVR